MRRSAARSPSVWRYPIALLILLSAVATAPLPAQEPSRESEALRRIRQQFAKLQQEYSRLQEENGRLQQANGAAEEKLKAAASDVTKLKSETGRLRKSAAALKAAENENAALQTRLAATDETLKQTVQASREQIAGLQSSLTDSRNVLEKLQRDSQQTVGTLQASVERETARVTACENKNAQLYGVTMDLIDRYKQNRGAWEKFLLSEPFTGLKSVEVDNLLQEFRERAAKARTQSSAPGGDTK
jgi:chromosome segregation ATPase